SLHFIALLSTGRRLQSMPRRPREVTTMRRHLWTLIALNVVVPAFAQPVPTDEKKADPTKPAAPTKASDTGSPGTAKSDEFPPAPGGPQVEVQFGDGSLVKLTLLDPKLDIATRYGKLSVPLNEIRRIELGVRYPEGALQKIQDAITRLGDADYKKREAASGELLAFRELAYPHVRRAAAMPGNAEAVKRAKALLE